MKNCLIAIALFAVVAVVSAVETTVMKYVPDSSVIAAEINVDKLLRNPAVLEVINKPENVERRREYEKKSGVRLTDLKTVWLCIDQTGSGVAFCRLARDLALEDFFAKTDIAYRKNLIGGKVVYQLSEKESEVRRKADVAVLEPGLLAIGEREQIVKYLKGKRGNAGDLKKVVQSVPEGTAIWLAFVNRIKLADGVVDDPQQLYLTFDFAGKNQDDLDFKFRFACGSSEGAKMLSARIPMFVMMGSALIFGKDPELGNQVAACLKRRVKGSVVWMTSYIGNTLARQISDYFEKHAESLISQQKSARKSL